MNTFFKFLLCSPIPIKNIGIVNSIDPNIGGKSQYESAIRILRNNKK